MTTDSSGSVLAVTSTVSKAEGEDRNFRAHPCIVSDVRYETSLVTGSLSWSLTVFPCRSFSGISDPAAWIEAMSPALKDRHIPLPPPAGHEFPPTPAAFGRPIEASLIPLRCTWILAQLHNVNMGVNGGVSFNPLFEFLTC
jgi:hypothetical protein